MLVAIDVPTAALVIGVVALCITTAISSLALPEMTFWRRRHRRNSNTRNADTRHANTFPVLERRVVTGRAATIPPLALPPAPRRSQPSPDDPTEELQEAERLVHHLLEHDPARLAALLASWINADHERTRQDA